MCREAGEVRVGGRLGQTRTVGRRDQWPRKPSYKDPTGTAAPLDKAPPEPEGRAGTGGDMGGTETSGNTNMVDRGIDWRQNRGNNDQNGRQCHHGRGIRATRDGKGIDVRCIEGG